MLAKIKVLAYHIIYENELKAYQILLHTYFSKYCSSKTGGDRFEDVWGDEVSTSKEVLVPFLLELDFSTSSWTAAEERGGGEVVGDWKFPRDRLWAFAKSGNSKVNIVLIWRIYLIYKSCILDNIWYNIQHMYLGK